MRLLILFLVGVVLVDVAINANIGSFIGAIVCPDYMVDDTTSGAFAGAAISAAAGQ